MMRLTPGIILEHPWYLYSYNPDGRTRYVFRDKTCHSLDEALTYAAETRDQADRETAPVDQALRIAEETTPERRIHDGNRPRGTVADK